MTSYELVPQLRNPFPSSSGMLALGHPRLGEHLQRESNEHGRPRLPSISSPLDRCHRDRRLALRRRAPASVGEALLCEMWFDSGLLLGICLIRSAQSLPLPHLKSTCRFGQRDVDGMGAAASTSCERLAHREGENLRTLLSQAYQVVRAWRGRPSHPVSSHVIA